jgi:hypothetical protein
MRNINTEALKQLFKDAETIKSEIYRWSSEKVSTVDAITVLLLMDSSDMSRSIYFRDVKSRAMLDYGTSLSPINDLA